MKKEIYFIGGSEPYLVDCQKLSLVGKLSLAELNYMESECFSEDVVSFLNSYPIGDEYKVCHLMVEELDKLNTPDFQTYLEHPSDTSRLIVRFRHYDARKSFFKKLKAEGLLQLFEKETVLVKLPEFVQSRAQKKGATFESKEALELFLCRENYGNREDITLYNVLGDLNNLIALGSIITKENVLAVVQEHDVVQKFCIAGLLLSKDVHGLRKQAHLCAGDEIGALSALLWEYRVAYKAKFFSFKEIGTFKATLSKLPKEVLFQGIMILTDAVDSVKQGTAPKSSLLEATFLKLASDIHGEVSDNA